MGNGEHLEIARQEDIGVPDRRDFRAEAHSPLDDFQRTLEKARVIGTAEIDCGVGFEIRNPIAAPKSKNADIGAAGLQHAHAPRNRRIGDVVDEVRDPQR
jgi:hypothetical protein